MFKYYLDEFEAWNAEKFFRDCSDQTRGVSPRHNDKPGNYPTTQRCGHVSRFALRPQKQTGAYNSYQHYQLLISLIFVYSQHKMFTFPTIMYNTGEETPPAHKLPL
jgi:hypothetical protein